VAGIAAWCSLGTLGLVETGGLQGRVGFLPPWWLLPILIVCALVILRLIRLPPAALNPLFGLGLAILPWLPVPLPAAALVWTGPVAIAVWVFAIAGAIAARGPMRRPFLIDPRRAPIAAGAVALCAYGFSAWWLAPILPDGDAPHYLILAQSLIKDGDLRIENNHRQGDHLEYAPQAAEPHYQVRGANGEIYSIHAPGLPAVIAPVYALFGYRGVVGFLGLVAALGTVLVWRFGYAITGAAGAAWFGWASAALTTPFFFQTTQVFPDGLAATCVLLGTLPLLSSASFAPSALNRSSASSAFNRSSWLLSGTALALLPWLQTRLALVAAAAAVAVALRARTIRETRWFFAPAAVSAIAWFAYFFVIYGTFDPTAPYGDNTQTTVANLGRGFPGLLFDQQFGMIPNAPVYGFVIAGLLVAAARRARWGWEVLLVAVPYLIGVGMFQLWWGGASAPVRLLAPLALLLGVAAARVWHAHPSGRAFGFAALIASVLITMALLVPGRGRLLFNDRDGIALWIEWASAMLDLPRGLPSVFRDSTGEVWLKIAIWIGCFAAAYGAMAWRRSRRLSAWPVVAALLTALTLSWRISAVGPLTPAASEYQLLQNASRHRRVAYDYRSRELEPPGELLSRVRIRTDRQRRAVAESSGAGSKEPGLHTLLSVPELPPGSYEVHVTPLSASGTLQIRIGDTALPLWTGSADGAGPGTIGPAIRLPVPVRSLVVEGDEPAHRTVSEVALGPQRADRLFEPRGAVPGSAYRAVRYGSAQVFFMDADPYPEAAGFWVQSARTARIVVLGTGRNFLFLRNAPIDNTITVDIAGERRDIPLRADEETSVTLQTNGDLGVVVTIGAAKGVRPSERDPANGDGRYLGCWIEIR
jgi:hypothetical protein